MNDRSPHGSDEPEEADQVMLAVLSNRGRSATVLSPEDERLLDDWVAGRLAPDDAERAVALAKQNVLAAERVLERRLQDAAGRGAPVPQHLAAGILKSNAPARTSTAQPWWRSLGRWQWTSIAGAAALASILVVAGMPVLQQMMSASPLQVATVTINDRGPLFEASDIRMRGTTPPPPVVGERFRDVEMPTALLRDLVATTGQAKGAAAREIERYVLGPGGPAGPLHVIVDTALKPTLERTASERTLVRIYDLNDPRSANVKSLIGLPPGNQRSYLVTLKP